MTVETKEISIEESNDMCVVQIAVSGRLTREDYDIFVPAIEKYMAAHDAIRLLLELHDFKGWTAGALWEDTKFDVRHFKDIERLAVVGEKKWEKGMTLFMKPFTTAKVRYFDRSEGEKAREWLKNG